MVSLSLSLPLCWNLNIILIYQVVIHFIRRWSGLFNHIFFHLCDKGKKKKSSLPITLVTFSRELEEECGVLCACIFSRCFKEVCSTQDHCDYFLHIIFYSQKHSCKTHTKKTTLETFSFLVIKHDGTRLCYSVIF